MHELQPLLQPLTVC